MEKLGKEPAFPVDPYFEGLKNNDARCYGMSKRLYLAGMAMQGILAGGYFNLYSNHLNLLMNF